MVRWIPPRQEAGDAGGEAAVEILRDVLVGHVMSQEVVAVQMTERH